MLTELRSRLLPLGMAALSGAIVISERHFRPAAAQVEAGENPHLRIRADVCDPASMRTVEVDRERLDWFLTEQPVACIGRLMRVYYRGKPE